MQWVEQINDRYTYFTGNLKNFDTTKKDPMGCYFKKEGVKHLHLENTKNTNTSAPSCCPTKKSLPNLIKEWRCLEGAALAARGGKAD